MATPRPITVKLEPRQQLVLAGLAACAGLAVATHVLFAPALGRIVSARSMLRELHTKQVEAQSMNAQLPEHEAALAKAQVQHQALERWIGSGNSLARILESLGDQAKRHRVNISVVQAGLESRHGPPRQIALGPGRMLQEVPLEVTLTGRYAPIGEFLGGLSGAPFLSSVQSLTLKKPDPADVKLQADLALVVYVRTDE